MSAANRQANRVELTIDDCPTRVPEGTTILEAAEGLGIEIPTLCHNQALTPFGSCWICAVKVDGARTLVPACSTRVVPGMQVTTLDDEIRRTRKLCLELLLSDHYGDCLAPCQMTCPAGIDVQGYLAHAARGEYREAVRLIKQRNPLPLICGRVCPRPCEDMCRRQVVDEPVSVNAVKRFVADWDRSSGEHYVPPRAAPTGKRVAVVGGGPAGLTCAYFLAQRGHEVTVFEALPQLGGMLRWGIPAYRLPRDILDAEIDSILELGVRAECGKRLGADFTLQDLRDQGYEAVFLGLGATASRRMRAEGEDLPGVLGGTDFLREIGLGKQFDFSGKKVTVVGGGNTAIDAARTSLRLGAQSVTVLYRRSRAEMPAQDEEVQAAEEEGVEFHFLAAPKRLIGRPPSPREGVKGRADDEAAHSPSPQPSPTGRGSPAQERLAEMEYERMELGEPDASGRRRPVPIPGSESTLAVDVCIAAIGQKPELSLLAGTPLRQTDWGALASDPYTLATEVEGVFAGGDCVSGAATVVEAVAHGREAAVSIDRYLHGRSFARDEPVFNISKGDWDKLDPADFEHYLRAPRAHHSCLDVAQRIAGFDEVEQGLSEDAMRGEAERCLSCGCASAFDCRVRQLAAEYGVDPERFADGARRKELPDEEHPLIRLESQKCILCGACVRVCDEVRDVRALGFEGRGFAARVRPAFGESLLSAGCITCGACVDVCPTGAIVERLGQQGGPFATETSPGVCAGCGVGCVYDVHRVGGRPLTVRPRKDPHQGPNNGLFCITGRFGLRALDPEQRILAPMVRREGELRPVSLDEAVHRAVRLLVDTDQALALVSPHATVEEMQTVQALAGALTGAQAGSLSATREQEALRGLDRVLPRPQSPASVQDLPGSDCVFLVECDPQRSHPVAGVQALAARRAGAQLLVLASEPTALDCHASLRLRSSPGGTVVVLAGLLRRLLTRSHGAYDVAGSDALLRSVERISSAAVEQAADVAPAELDELCDRLARARNPVVVLDTSRAGARLSQAAALVAGLLATQAARPPLLALRPAANSHGLTRQGLRPVVLPAAGHPTILTVREDVAAATQGRALPAVVADAVWSESAAHAQVVLPLPTRHEMRGHVYATGGLEGVTGLGVQPAGGEEVHEVLGRLAAACGVQELSAQALQPPGPMTARAAPLGEPLSPESLCTPPEPVDTYARLIDAWARDQGLLRD